MSALRSPIRSALYAAIRSVMDPIIAVGGSVFSPSDWFVNGEDGLFYNFNELGAGNLVLGAEMNPQVDFNSAAGWTVGSNMTIAGGALNADVNWTVGQSSHANVLVRGKTYLVEAVVENFVGTGQFSINMGNNPSADGRIVITGNGTYKAVLRCDTASAPERLQVGNLTAAGYSFSITRLSCIEVLSGYQPTMFQLSTGAFPVNARGQPVGLTLDQRLKNIRGPELIANGDFSSPAGWTLATNVTIIGGLLNFGNPVAAGTGATYVVPGLVAGRTYRIAFTVLNRSAGSYQPSLGGSLAPATNATGLYVNHFVAGAVNQEFSILGVGSLIAQIDDCSVVEVPGNHATQPTAAARPLYGAVDGAMGAVFDAVDDRLVATVPMSGDEFTSVMLVKRNGSPTRFLFDYSTGNTGNGLYYLGTNPYVPVWWTGAVAFEPSGGNFLQGDFDVITTAHDGVQGYHRKGLQALIPVATAFAPNSGNTAVLGMSRSFTLPADASIVMWVLVNKYKTPAEQDQLVTWMLQQAGLLP